MLFLQLWTDETNCMVRMCIATTLILAWAAIHIFRIFLMSLPSLSQSTKRTDFSNELLKLKATPAGMAMFLSNGSWKAAKHLIVLSKCLIEAVTGRQRFLIVQMPPRHGKSELISHWFPVWVLEIFPSKRVMLASYEADFASSWGRKVRDTIIANSHNLRVRVTQSSSAANRWDTSVSVKGKLISAGGGMVTCGIGGSLTGRGADVLVIDDPIKNAEEAKSPTVRNILWDWFTSTAFTRIEPGGCCIVVMTRWHEDDLVGRLLEHQARPDYVGAQWKVVNLPAVCEEENDAIGRKLGEPLWPQRYNRAQLKEIENTTDDWVWAALYQQRPTLPGGTIFRKEWWDNGRNRYKIQDQAFKTYRVIARFQSWDTGLKDKENSAYTVCVTVDLTDDYRVLVRDVYRERLTFDKLPDAIEEKFAQWNYDGKLQVVLIEDKVSGTSAYQTLVASAESEVGKHLLAYAPSGDKETRASQAAIWCRNNCIWLPFADTLCPWLYDFEQELLRFPSAKYKDQVDTFSQVTNYLENMIAEGYRIRTGYYDNEDTQEEYHDQYEGE